MKKYIVELTKEQLQQLGVDIEKVESDFKYPLFKQWRITGEIIKFTSITRGVIVWKGSRYEKVGYVSDKFISHTDKEWEDVAYDSERCLWDGQPIECYDNEGTHKKVIGFYDAKNRCSFNYAGKRRGLPYDSYKALSPDRYDKWILEAYKTLEK